MNIGTAIKFLRKERKLSQKDLAEKCVISPNALRQIENNSSFPHQNTIKKICSALAVPVSYLLFFSISDDDIPEEQKPVFKSLNSAIKAVLVDAMNEGLGSS